MMILIPKFLTLARNQDFVEFIPLPSHFVTIVSEYILKVEDFFDFDSDSAMLPIIFF